MKLGLGLGPWDSREAFPLEAVLAAERLGYDLVSTSETYGADAMSSLAFVGARTSRIRLLTSIAQLDARTPANLAMTAQTIDALSGEGRMMVGIGASGPQIVEGWYGRPWGRPNPRLRDTVAVLKKIFRREGPVSYQGQEISLPYAGVDASGLGKPLKSLMKATPDLPVLLGSDTPLNVRLAGEIADGWIGFHLVPAMMSHYRSQLAEGLAKRTDGKTLAEFEIHATLGVIPQDDVRAALQEPKPHVALYVGGMGARSRNFHKESMIKRGYPEAAERIQELFLAGRKEEAAAAVPDEYVDEEWLVGPPARLRERFRPWRDSGIDVVTIRRTTPEVLELVADVAQA